MGGSALLVVGRLIVNVHLEHCYEVALVDPANAVKFAAAIFAKLILIPEPILGSGCFLAVGAHLSEVVGFIG